MIVPHSEESTFSLRIPLYAVKLAVIFLVLGVAGLCVLGYAYLRTAAEAQEALTLRQINRAQQEEIDALAVETQRMMEQIREIDELVELVTERLDLEPEELENLQVQPQQNHDPGSLHGVELLDFNYNRNNGSRYNSGGVLERAANNIALLQDIVPERSETLDIVEEYVSQAEARPSIWPTRGRLASGFGMRRIPYAKSGYQFHTGVDIIGAYGTSVWATAGGLVIYTGYRGSLGNLVVIDHGYGYETYYAHLSGFAVSAGEHVERGQTIGYMGSSGRTTGTHLHYEVHYNGSPVNPANYMKKQ